MRILIRALAMAATLATTLPAAAVDVRDGWRDGRGWHQVRKQPPGCRNDVTKSRTPNGDLVARRVQRCE